MAHARSVWDQQPEWILLPLTMLGQQRRRSRPPTSARNGKPVLPLAAGARIYLRNLDSAVAAEYGTVVATPNEADVAILNLDPPFDPEWSGMLRQGRLHYTADELEPMLAIMRQTPTVVTLYLERPAVIPEIAESAAAVLANFGATDRAILDVLFGRFGPEGRLPFEMPSSWEAVLNQMEDVPFDSRDPLFPFGHGLRYEPSSGGGVT